jgi:hypothetical protein
MHIALQFYLVDDARSLLAVQEMRGETSKNRRPFVIMDKDAYRWYQKWCVMHWC